MIMMNDIYIYNQIVLLAWISQILFLHPSLSSIIPVWSSKLHLVYIQSCCRYILAGQPTLECPCVEVHWQMWHEFVFASPAVSCMSCLSYLDGFSDGRLVQLFYGVLLHIYKNLQRYLIIEKLVILKNYLCALLIGHSKVQLEIEVFEVLSVGIIGILRMNSSFFYAYLIPKYWIWQKKSMYE